MKNLINRILTSSVLLIIVYFSIINTSFLFIILLIISYLTLIELNSIFKYIFKKNLHLLFISILISLVYLCVFSLSIWSHLFSLNPNNIASITFLLAVCASTDIGGFLFGKIIGGRKLTKISPNKTYSGLIGSILLSMLCGLVFNNFFYNLLIFKIDIMFLILLISLISQFGDLLISFLKRKANIKDTGNILPGHGGILDRIDGILLAFPIGIFLATT